MNKLLYMGVCVLLLALNSAASAAVNVLAPGVLSPSGTPVETFDNRPLGQGSFVGADGGLYTGFGTIVNGSATNLYAAPFFGPGPYSGVGAPPVSASGQDVTNYLTLGPTSGPNAGTPETITYSTTKDIFGLYWGSVDTYNTIDFYLGANKVLSFSGSDVSPLLSASGCQTSFGCNGYVLFSGLSFDRVVLGSASNYAFEMDNVFAAAAPEPSTWMLLILGFAGLALLRSRKTLAAAV